MLLHFVARIRIRRGNGFEQMDKSVQAVDHSRAKLLLEAQYGHGSVISIRRV
jgi:hypothetical protein